MQAVGNYNKISDEFKKQIPKLEGVAIIQMLNGVPNPDDVERVNQPFLFGKKQLQTSFKIRDPHTKDLVNIVLAEDWTPEKTPTKPKCFVAGAGETQFQGLVTLHEGNTEHEELYEVLWLSPEREGSMFTDKNTPKLFRFVNKKEESKTNITKVDKLREALERAKSMKTEELTQFGLSMNWDETDVLELQSKTFDYARANVESFLSRVDSSDIATKATLKKALMKGVITFDVVTGSLKTSTSELTVLTVNSDNFELLEEATKFINNSPKGEEILKGIEKELSAPAKASGKKS